MKILLISLLRLGDVLLSTSVIRGLKREYPDAEIHILINQQFSRIAGMIPDVAKVYFFDRMGIQNILGQSDHNLLEAYFRVEDLVDELKAQNFDRVVNLTHNRLSGWIATLVNCPDTRGVMFRKDGKLSLGSSWFEYLNRTSEKRETKPFHFVDVFHYGVGLNQGDRRLYVNETERGKSFANAISAKYENKKLILVQAGSFEQKKTLILNAWRDIINQFTKMEPMAEIFVLGSNEERNLITSICNGISRTQPLVCDLDEAFSLLKKASLLLTTDTSIKHLAAAAGTKIVEISVGSSDYLKTGAFTDGAVILQGNVACAPCSHSTACHQASHLCGEAIDPSLVTMTMRATLNRDDEALRVLAHEYRDAVTVLKTHVNSVGDWSAYPLAPAFQGEEIGTWVDRASQKLQMQEVFKKSIGEYGTEGTELKKLLLSMYPNQTSKEWQKELKILESDFSGIGLRLVELMKNLKETLAQLGNEQKLDKYMDLYASSAKDIAAHSVFRSYGLELGEALEGANTVPFTAVAKMRERLSKAYQRYKIELKLIRGLQTEFMEII